MKSIKMYMYLGLIAFSLSNCKGDLKSTTENSAPGDTNKQYSNQVEPIHKTVSDTGKNSFLVATPEGYYEPKGLIKLDLVEMFKLGSRPDFKKDFVLRDKDGYEVGWKIMENPEKKMFMQMYVNEEGKVVEAVVFPFTEELQALIMKVRMTNN